MIKKFALPLLLAVVFSITGLGVFAYKTQIKYLFLFSGIGTATALGACLFILIPGKKQAIRRIIQACIGGTLFIGLSLYGNVNFQASQIIFDLSAGVVAGALIQFLIARIVMPFFIGNGFCSMACWDGAVFELIQNRIPKAIKPRKRSSLVAWTYLLGVVLLATGISFVGNPAIHESYRRYWIIGENIMILGLGVGLSSFWGSRAYCRFFCPFITVSGLLSRFSIFKIAPVKYDSCTGCGVCNKACPMLVDVRDSVKNNQRISNRTCILCERCVDACPEKCLKLAPDFPWK